MRNLIRRLRGQPVQLSPKQEAKMAAMQARADALPGEAPVSPPDVRGMFKQAIEGFRDSVGESFDAREGVIFPGPGAPDMNRPPPEIEDASQRTQVATAERASRAAARAPYRAAERPEVAFTRFGTTGKAQLADLQEHLRSTGLAAYPERVFGVYRIPDRSDLGHNSEGRTYMEWEIAHRPRQLSATTDDVAITGFPRSAHWVARRPGYPSVLDEDVSGTFVMRAGIRPEDCFGLTRLIHVRGRDSDAGKSWYAQVEGALVITRASESVARAHEQMMADAPLALDTDLPLHREILDWEAVAAWVAPDRRGPPRVPSPLPHLPSDWQELMLAYLEVVGVRSEDCFGAQVTRTTESILADLSLASFRKNLGSPPKLPSADGTDRERMHAAEHVVIAYRDRPEYHEGRARWRAYQDEVLHAKLDHLTGVRPPIEVSDLRPVPFAREVFDMFNPLDPVHAFPQIFNRNERPSLGPYCGTLP